MKIAVMVICTAVLASAILSPGLQGQKSNEHRPAVTSSRANAMLDSIQIEECNRPSRSAISTAQLALRLSRRVHDTAGQARALAIIGSLYLSRGEFRKGEPFLLEALTLSRRIKNSAAEARIRLRLGDAYNHLGKPESALHVLNAALNTFNRSNDKAGAAEALVLIGESYYASNLQKAADAFKEGLRKSQESHDLKTQALIMNDQGASLQSTDPDLAFDTYEHALTIENQIHDCRGKAATLANIASFYTDKGRARDALNAYSDALELERRVGDQSAEAQILHGMANFYDNMGDPHRALSLYSAALSLERRTGDVAAEGPTLGTIAGIHKELKDPQSARLGYLKSLQLLNKTNDQLSQVLVLNNLGAVENDLHHPKEARVYFEAAIGLASKTGDAATPGFSAWGIGCLEEDDALTNYVRGLRIAQQFGMPGLAGAIQSSLMEHFRIHKQRDQAIFFGKLAVNQFQIIRQNTGELKDIASRFLQSKTETYRTLAQLLIDVGRLAEAQEVLDLLKEQEYVDFVRGDREKVLSALSLSFTEQKAEEEYQRATAKIASIGEQWSQLSNLSARSAEQEQQYQQLSTALAMAGRDLDGYFARLYTLFGKNKSTNQLITDVKGTAVFLRQQLAQTPHSVALYTVVAKHRYSVLVIPQHGPAVGRKYEIGEQELNRKIASFQHALRDPTSDPRPLAQALYRILVGPVRKDLDQLQAKTLVWSLDGAIRYIPMGALYDGDKYLVQNYNIVAYTPASAPYLSEKPQVDSVSAVAMGLSGQYGSLKDLPSVATELKSIVSDPALDSQGVLPGTILLDGRFTEKAMEETLARQRRVIHIASHFVLKPGNADQSYLMLAGRESDTHGYHLTVAELRDNPKLRLENTDLLTLSACDTGVNSTAESGREIDGLATTAQLKGVRAVIASLWAVNDESTGALMTDFYKNWVGSTPGLTKLEALRQAQTDLLTTKIRPQPGAADWDRPISYSHPFFWAPFVLMGNWQ